MSLKILKDTVQQIAIAITSALELETEIINNDLMIIGGTGRYKEMIGTYEEDGDLEADFLYPQTLKTGNDYINFNAQDDPFYNATGTELAEICSPIKWENKVLGIISLVAFTEEQRTMLVNKTNEYRKFLHIMAELIADKYALAKSNDSLKHQVSSLLEISNTGTSFGSLLGTSNAMQQVKMRALQVSSSNSTILITGESGTGKNLLAQSIHAESPRREKPFISVNCAAIPEMLLESELFGYVKGAFTGAEKSGKLGKFQLADKGTLFLDEIGDMPLHLQAKLLNCLQNRQVDPVGGTEPVDIDVRIIAATNKNLEEMISQKLFREDLYFRLNVIPIHIPPLRERPEDIDELILYFITKFNEVLGKNIIDVDSAARSALLSYTWPGNIREIENAIEYAINMENTDTIMLSSLPAKIAGNSSNVVPPYSDNLSLRKQLKMAERFILMESLKKVSAGMEGKKQVANMLGISEATLYRKLHALNIPLK